MIFSFLMRLPDQPAIAIAILFTLQAAQTEGVPPGEIIPLNGTTSASNSRLDGVIIRNDLIPFQIKDDLENIILEGQVQDRVVLSNKTGKLIFSSRLRDLSSPDRNNPIQVSYVRLHGFGGFLTD